MKYIDIDSDISKYILSEVKNQKPFFKRMFNIYLNDYIKRNKKIEGGCFSQKINMAYEKTLNYFKLTEAKQEYIYYRMLFRK